jgi:hypothetical protein
MKVFQTKAVLKTTLPSLHLHQLRSGFIHPSKGKPINSSGLDVWGFILSCEVNLHIAVETHQPTTNPYWGVGRWKHFFKITEPVKAVKTQGHLTAISQHHKGSSESPSAAQVCLYHMSSSLYTCDPILVCKHMWFILGLLSN